MKNKKRKITCPICGGMPTENHTRYGLRLSCCKLWAWGIYPLANAETHSARKLAHLIFDEIWKSGRATRTQCYMALAAALEISREECHIKLMDAQTALRVVDIVKDWNKNAERIPAQVD